MTEQRETSDRRSEEGGEADPHGGAQGGPQTGMHGRSRGDIESENSLDEAARRNEPGGRSGGDLATP